MSSREKLGDADEDGNDAFQSQAPISVRGPFSLFDSVREHASKDRLRYRMDGFNLDLRYITPNLVAMAAPSDRGVMSTISSNHVDEVVRFFRMKHDSKVVFYNLIGEANAWHFDANRLGVVNHQFAFLDHSVPSLTQMQAFCLSVKQWLDLDPANVAVVLCKSGRNRTAIMICAYLLYRWPAEFGTASEVMEYFAHRRMRMGPAVKEPSQRRWISYFSQRFAAHPQSVRISKVVVPHAPLRMHKLRLVIDILMPGSSKGNSVREETVWTSKGKAMGLAEVGESYVVFSFGDGLELAGDIRLSIWGRKFTNGAFSHLFHMWFNTGFVDHTPMVWDKQCLDGIHADKNTSLPDDFHIQTLFVGFPRIACSISKIRPARIYCWDCEDPFLSEEDSIELHKRRTTMGENGEEEDIISGPRHRYHPLIEEECALCERRRQGWNERDMTGHIVHHEGVNPHTGTSQSTLEFRGRTTKAKTEEGTAAKTLLEADSRVWNVEEGLKKVGKKKEIIAREKARELASYAQPGDKGQLKEKIKAPIYNFPSVYCEDTSQYLCSWCSHHALGPSGRSMTKIAIPLIPSSEMRYSGCARQAC
mmetsp:Transcript_10160/g.19867  ORF Transcript_10160/g.19867 Transcript_10160/m.19867 type:complete len:589 (+) Transcript_10160:54-1820(+)